MGSAINILLYIWTKQIIGTTRSFDIYILLGCSGERLAKHVGEITFNDIEDLQGPDAVDDVVMLPSVLSCSSVRNWIGGRGEGDVSKQ